MEYMYSEYLTLWRSGYEGRASFEASTNADLFDDLAITIAESLYTKMLMKPMMR